MIRVTSRTFLDSARSEHLGVQLVDDFRNPIGSHRPTARTDLAKLRRFHRPKRRIGQFGQIKKRWISRETFGIRNQWSFPGSAYLKTHLVNQNTEKRQNPKPRLLVQHARQNNLVVRLKVPVTTRGVARSFAVVTGQTAPELGHHDLDFYALARAKMEKM